MVRKGNDLILGYISSWNGQNKQRLRSHRNRHVPCTIRGSSINNLFVPTFFISMTVDLRLSNHLLSPLSLVTSRSIIKRSFPHTFNVSLYTIFWLGRPRQPPPTRTRLRTSLLRIKNPFMSSLSVSTFPLQFST